MVIRENTDQYMEEPRRWLSETGFHWADRPRGGGADPGGEGTVIFNANPILPIPGIRGKMKKTENTAGTVQEKRAAKGQKAGSPKERKNI